MRKCTIIIAVLFCAIAVMAGPPRHHGPRGGWGPRPYGGYYHHHHHGNDGVWLAAGITNIVANGLGIVRQVTAPPVYAAPAPVVYEQPTVVAPPVVRDPIVYTPTPVIAPAYYPPVRQEWRNIPIYNPYGQIVGYRQVLMDVK